MNENGNRKENAKGSRGEDGDDPYSKLYGCCDNRNKDNQDKKKVASNSLLWLHPRVL